MTTTEGTELTEVRAGAKRKENKGRKEICSSSMNSTLSVVNSSSRCFYSGKPVKRTPALCTL
jgi:hypothetical protein